MRVILLALFVTAITPGAPARASTAFDRLDELNLKLDAAADKVKLNVGASAERRAAQIQDLQSLADEVRGKLTADLSSEADAFELVKKKLAHLDQLIGFAKTMQRAMEMRQAIVNIHLQNRPATSTDFATYQAAIDALQKSGEPALADGARSLRDEFGKLQAENRRLEELVAKIARLESSRMAAIKAQKETEDRVTTRADRAYAAARQTLESAYAVLAEKDVPLPDGMTAALDRAAKSLEPFSEQAREALLAETRFLRLVDEWLSVDADVLPAMAKMLGGDPIASGTLREPKLARPFQAKSGWCYAALLHSVRAGGASPGTFAFQSRAKGESGLQPFRVWRDPRAGVVYGACATLAEPAGFGGTLGADAKNGARWVLLGWPRAKFPRDLARNLSVTPPNPCDAKAWMQQWTEPVPGSIVFAGGEPRLVVEDVPEQQVVVRTLAFERIALTRRVVTGRPANGPTLPTLTPPLPSCFPGAPRSADNLALAKCRRNLAAKHTKTAGADAVQLDEDLATFSPHSLELASYATDEWKTDDAKQCGPAERRVQTAWEKAVKKIGEALVKQTSDPIDRPALMADAAAWAEGTGGR